MKKFLQGCGIFLLLASPGGCFVALVEWETRHSISRYDEWMELGCRRVEAGVPNRGDKTVSFRDKWLCPDGTVHWKEPLFPPAHRRLLEAGTFRDGN